MSPYDAGPEVGAFGAPVAASRPRTIAVVGAGYVGVVSAACLADLGHQVILVDVDPAKVSTLDSGLPTLAEAGIAAPIAEAHAAGRWSATDDLAAAVRAADLSMVSVGTPSDAAGNVRLDAVDAALDGIGQALRRHDRPHTVVLRSTVPPGTGAGHAIPLLEARSGRSLGDGLAYFSNPEFLREGSAMSDFRAPPHTVIGTPEGQSAQLLVQLYAAIPAPVRVVPLALAESVKYLGNVFHAVKLAFANEAGAVLATLGVDVPAAFDLFRADTTLNVSAAYLRPGFAFGGSCLPKDVRGFLSLARDAAVATPFLDAVLPSNDAVLARALARVPDDGRPVALLGLAFKPGTGDLRESSYVRLAHALAARGHAVRLYDSVVRRGDAATQDLPGTLYDRVTEAVAGCATLIVGHLSRADADAVPILSGRTVIDLRVLPAAQMATSSRAIPADGLAP